jgi:archaemetzincin
MRTFILITTFLLLSCNNKKSGYFSAISENDIKLETPKEGEWLYEHKEKGQSFEEYKNSHPIRPTANKAVIYLMPIGDFTEPQQKILNLTREYVEIFFQQKTVLLKAVSDKTVPFRQREDGNIQLLAPYVLDSLLIGKTPDDGIALLAISAKDLYPKSDWNYVFGLASYVKRVGVSSIYRLQDTRRLINVASHEIGHMMSLHHCTFAKCTMNGSNGLAETDAAPNRLCSACQQKLYWNFTYDNRKRLKELMDFCKENALEKDYDILKLDYEKDRPSEFIRRS